MEDGVEDLISPAASEGVATEGMPGQERERMEQEEEVVDTEDLCWYVIRTSGWPGNE